MRSAIDPRSRSPLSLLRRGDHRPPRAAFGAAAIHTALALCLATLGCGDAKRATPAAGRVLIVGLDGASRKVIDPMIEAGRLPTLAALQTQGARGALRPGLPILSPRIWTSIATGRTPEDHGIEDWVMLGPAGGLRLYSNLDRRAPALWNILSAAGRGVGVVNWLITQPPDVVNGVMISDHAVPGMTESRIPLARDVASQRFGAEAAQKEVYAPEVATAYAYPPEWIQRSAALREAAEPLTRQANPFLGSQWQGHPVFDFLRGVYRDDELTARTALAVEREQRPDLMMVYLPGVDRVSHLLWQGIELPGAPIPNAAPASPQLRARNGAALRAYYRFTDALLSKLLAAYGPDDLVIVISDHGFEAQTLAQQMPGVHESEEARDGVLYLRGPRVPRGAEVGVLDAVDIAPSVLAWLGLPVANDWPGRPAAFLGLAEPQRIASYSDVPVERVSAPASDVDDAILEKLRTLGYVE